MTIKTESGKQARSQGTQLMVWPGCLSGASDLERNPVGVFKKEDNIVGIETLGV